MVFRGTLVCVALFCAILGAAAVADDAHKLLDSSAASGRDPLALEEGGLRKLLTEPTTSNTATATQIIDVAAANSLVNIAANNIAQAGGGTIKDNDAVAKPKVKKFEPVIKVEKSKHHGRRLLTEPTTSNTATATQVITVDALNSLVNVAANNIAQAGGGTIKDNDAVAIPKVKKFEPVIKVEKSKHHGRRLLTEPTTSNTAIATQVITVDALNSLVNVAANNIAQAGGGKIKDNDAVAIPKVKKFEPVIKVGGAKHG